MKPTSINKKAIFELFPKLQSQKPDVYKRLSSIFDYCANSSTKNNVLDGNEINKFSEWIKREFPNIAKSIDSRVINPPLKYDYVKLDAFVHNNMKKNKPILEKEKKLFHPDSFLTNLSKCDSRIVNSVIEVAKIAKRLGLTVQISDGFRSREVQEAAYNNPKKKGYVAEPGRSAHEAGMAVDIALWKGNKKISVANIPEIADYLRKKGFEWGGDWVDPYEPWHYNIKNWRTEAEKFTK